MKKIAILMIFVMLLALAGCGSKKTAQQIAESSTEEESSEDENSEEESSEDESSEEESSEEENSEEDAEITGGWTLPESFEACELPEDAATAFEAAAKEFVGGDLTPIAFLGTQVVAGANYEILCYDGTSLLIVTVYADLDGSSTITDTAVFDVGAYTDGEACDPDVDVESLDGGWKASSDDITAQVDAVEIDNVTEATSDSDITYQPIAALATQVVAGTNTAYLCRAKTPDGAYFFAVVTIYTDLENNSSLMSICAVELGA